MSNNDLISREYLRDAFDNLCCHNCKTCRNFRKEGCSFYRCDLIENAPIVELTETEIQEVLNKRCMTAVANEYLIALHGKRPKGEWEENSQGEWMPVGDGLPSEMNRYLVTTRSGEVMTDFYTGEHFLQGDDIIAWQPLPEPYERGGAEE